MAYDRRITSRSENYSEWYNDVLLAGDLIDESPVRGAVVLKPNGYALWERIKGILNEKIKESGHKNAYFPLLIPKSFLQKEADHVSGFALESAVVTHHRLAEIDGELQADPDSKLEEEYVIRPTSETIINHSFSRWIQSYRDLPLLVNQWANVMRWEMRTRPFLRTSEFLWQEGHTAHATCDDAVKEQAFALKMYEDFLRNYLAIDFVAGKKSESEKFAGAETTHTLEARMQDGKALQCCTSHNLGQNFAKAFDINFMNEENDREYVWQTSWGMSTRIIGAIVMSHADDSGLVLPPKIAPIQVRIIALEKEAKSKVTEKANELKEQLVAVGIRVEVDSDNHLSFGDRIFRSEKEGIPLRIELGPRDLLNDQVQLKARISDEKKVVEFEEIKKEVKESLLYIQRTLLERSRSQLNSNTVNVSDWKDFIEHIDQGKFVLSFWDGTTETEEQIRQETGATIRCLPFEQPKTIGKDIYSKKDGQYLALFAKAY